MVDLTLQHLVAALQRHDPIVAAADRAQAAVALVLAPDPARLLLIRRAERAGDPWSGHLALPGGRRDPSDTDLLGTAIRETAEETSVTLEGTSCVAQLDDLVPMTPTLPPLLVRPFVFVVPEAMPPGVSREVAHSAWVPLARLVADGVYGSRTVPVRGAPLLVPGYQLAEGFLWGMTERILAPVVAAWREANSRST